ncbi:MAG: hypothetical protein G8D88_13905 [gamma proteobacterium symbiont of Ctena orbiculata]
MSQNVTIEEHNNALHIKFPKDFLEEFKATFQRNRHWDSRSKSWFVAANPRNKSKANKFAQAVDQAVADLHEYYSQEATAEELSEIESLVADRKNSMVQLIRSIEEAEQMLAEAEAKRHQLEEFEARLAQNADKETELLAQIRAEQKAQVEAKQKIEQTILQYEPKIIKLVSDLNYLWSQRKRNVRAVSASKIRAVQIEIEEAYERLKNRGIDAKNIYWIANVNPNRLDRDDPSRYPPFEDIEVVNPEVAA